MTTDVDPERPLPSSSTEATNPTRAADGGSPTSRRPAGGGGGRGGPSRPSAGGAGRRSFGGRLPWLLAALGLIGTVGFAIAWHRAGDASGAAPTASVEGESATMAATARTFSEALTNFDGATIDRDFDRIVSLSSGEFRGQADEFFSSKVRKQLKEAQASSRGEVRSAYVQSFDGDRGRVFVVLDQTIANNQSPKPKADTLRMELSLVQAEGRWKVARVDVLTAPSGGDTSPGPAAATSPTVAGGGG